MECADCGVRSSVGYCRECEMLLCEVCSHTCEICGTTVCRSHIQRSSRGRSICVSCVVSRYDKRARQSRELRERRAERAELGHKVHKSRKPHKSHESRKSDKPDKPDESRREPVESLSFESLTRDVGPLPGGAPASEPEAPPRAEPSPRDFGEMPLATQEEINARVLTGSASQRSPTWLSGLGLGVVSWVLCVAAIRASEVDLQQAILVFVALIVALGTVVWTAPGAFARQAGPDRTRSRIAFAVGALALMLAGWLQAGRWLAAG